MVATATWILQIFGQKVVSLSLHPIQHSIRIPSVQYGRYDEISKSSRSSRSSVFSCLIIPIPTRSPDPGSSPRWRPPLRLPAPLPRPRWLRCRGAVRRRCRGSWLRWPKLPQRTKRWQCGHRTAQCVHALLCIRLSGVVLGTCPLDFGVAWRGWVADGLLAGVHFEVVSHQLEELSDLALHAFTCHLVKQRFNIIF